jgi:superfamily I DNA/RNA helicase
MSFINPAPPIALLHLLCPISEKNDLCVAGSDYQNIYGFRGVESTVFGNFKRDYNPQIVKLLQNYRCPEKELSQMNTFLATIS